MKKITKLGLVLFISGSSLFSFAQERSLGLIMNREADEKIPLISKPLGFGENLPESVDLTKYIPEIQDQGDYGTCVGWSSTYYLASVEYAVQRGITNKTELAASAYDPFLTYLSIVNNVSESSYSTCESGTYISDACEQLLNNGAKRVEIDGLDCGDNISDHKENSSVLDFTEYYRVYHWYDDWEENVTTACQSLANDHPVVFGIFVPRTFFEIGSDGLFKPTTEEKNDPSGTSYGGHALTIVGYDDNKFGGCFTVVNSWGEDWGDNGYFYITYEDYHIFTTSAFSFETKLKSEYSYEVGPVFGDCQNGYGIERIKGGGIFEGNYAYGVMKEGIYINHSKKLFKGGKLFMKKMVKKNYGKLLYDEGDYKRKKPIGFII